jgi:PKD repeat protein
VSGDVGDGSILSSPLTVDIAVTGCAQYDGATSTCTGPAPLTLSFVPVGSPLFTTFRWDFGDGSPEVFTRAPTHTYALPAPADPANPQSPGSYLVSVTAGGEGDAGTMGSRHTIAVVVTRIAVGHPCDVDAQCALGLTCRCAAGAAGCPAGFARGLCSSDCSDGACGDPAVATCAALPFATSVDAGAGPYQGCLASCASDADCGAGLSCLDLPAAASSGASGGWTRGCLPTGALAPLGAPCRDATGAFIDSACSTDSCADVGALGVCSATCDADNPCPSTAVCTRLRDGRSLCLALCTQGGNQCTRDPLLACTPTGMSLADGGVADAGPGSTLDAGSAAAVCGPKACTADSDCAPSGRCTGGQCLRL